MKTCTVCPGKHDLDGDLCPLCVAEEIKTLAAEIKALETVSETLAACRKLLDEIK